MKSFKFRIKQEAKTYTIFTFVAIVLSVFIFAGLNTYIDKYEAYLLVSILSFVSIMVAIRKANFGFKEISIEDETVKFYFLNKNKISLTIPKSSISVIIDENRIEFKFRDTDKLIGRAYKNRIIEPLKWDDLMNCF